MLGTTFSGHRFAKEGGSIIQGGAESYCVADAKIDATAKDRGRSSLTARIGEVDCSGSLEYRLCVHRPNQGMSEWSEPRVVAQLELRTSQNVKRIAKAP